MFVNSVRVISGSTTSIVIRNSQFQTYWSVSRFITNCLLGPERRLYFTSLGIVRKIKEMSKMDTERIELSTSRKQI